MTRTQNYDVLVIWEYEGKAREEAEGRRGEAVRDLGASDEG